MFNPLNKDSGRKGSQLSKDDLDAYLREVQAIEEEELVLIYSLLDKQDLSERDEKVLFNAILKADISLFDLGRTRSLFAKSKKAYFLVAEKLIDSGSLVAATKMLNLARFEDTFPNKYFYLKKRLRTCRLCPPRKHREAK